MWLEIFNDKAHTLLSEIFDDRERWLVRMGRCSECEASEYLTLDYIATCASLIEHGVVYLEIDEQLAADIFLAKLAKNKLKARFDRQPRTCAIQLSSHTRVYFPDYPKLLRLAYLHTLSATEDLDAIRRSGVLLLAAATLPGVRCDIQREFRRRGATWDRTIGDRIDKKAGICGTPPTNLGS